jgi:hypothetical protein
MNLKPWHTWAVVVLAVIMTVGCSAAAAPAVEESGPAPAWEAVGADGPVEALEARVEELEARLEALRWTEEEAIAVVQREIKDKLVACESVGLDLNECYFREDPVLWATPGGFTIYVVKAMLQEDNWDKWSAKYEPDFYRWRVEASMQDVQPLVFHAYEKTGLVVGVAPEAD